jgi:hypothetical protein
MIRHSFSHPEGHFKLILIAVIAFLLCASGSIAQVKIIFDTDIGGDADDLGALVMLNNFMSHGECELLGVMCWSTEQYAVPAIDAVNRFYGHPDIPIGTRKGDLYYEEWNYTRPIADHFYHELGPADVPDATLLYRRILAHSDDHSITLVTVGPLANIRNLIESSPDSISPLNGKELIEAKIREVVMMGGQFPSGENEWNFNGGMPGVTRFVLENITVPLTFSGYEIGDVIKTGKVFNGIDQETPLYVGFLHFSRNAPWIKKFYRDKILDNSSYDQTAVLYAVKKGEGVYWDKVTGGYCKPDDHGGNTWVEGPVTNQSYLKLKMQPEEMAELIESIMLNNFSDQSGNFPAGGQGNTAGNPAAKPLYRDPVYDGAADPSIVWNRIEKKWFMFYTNRRASAAGLDGVSWVHDTRIGIAESSDSGRNWQYRDTCDIRYREGDYTHWAPEVLEHNGLYHMFLTYVPGIFTDWKHPRRIVHLTSTDLLRWNFESRLDLSSERCIDACIFRMPDGTWRLYYNNELDGKSMYYADSPDLYSWKDSGKKVVGDRAGEGPKVFSWKNTNWMVVDNWNGLGVYSSDDMINWKRQDTNILSEPGKGADDGVIGQHPDVVVNGGRAYVFYFTHPGRTPENRGKDDYQTRRSSIQVAELEYSDGRILCDRDKPVYIRLIPPGNE